MKRVLIFGAVALLSGLELIGQDISSKSGIKTLSIAPNGRWVCAGEDEKPCTESQVKALAAALVSGQSAIKSLVLAAPDGTLDCRMANQRPCTPVQFEAARAVATKGISGNRSEPGPPVQSQVTVTKSLSNIKNNIEIHRDQDGTLVCTSADAEHTPCSKDQVAQLSAFNSSKSGIKTLTLAAPDGTLTCLTPGNKKCAAAEFTLLTNAAAAMNSTTSPKPNPNK